MQVKNYNPRFSIGTQFIRNMGKKRNDRIETVIDIIRFINTNNQCMGWRYICSHDFIGQTVIDYDVVEPTIALGTIISE